MENGLRRDHFHGTRVVSSDGCQIKHLSADCDIDVVRVVLERVAVQLRSVEDVLRGTDDGRDEDDDEDDEGDDPTFGGFIDDEAVESDEDEDEDESE